MIHDIQKDAFGSLVVGRLHSELFDCEMDVILHGDEEAYLAYAEKCAAYFNALPPEVMDGLRRFTLRYYNDMKRFNGEEPTFPRDVNADNLWEHIEARCLLVERPKDFGKVAFGVQLDCDWEPAHGLEWTLNDGNILYVGDFINVSAWYPPRVYQTECASFVDEHFSLG